MKKIFAKELAALAVLALAFTGCNTAFDGTNANFSEKESEYTEISGNINSFANEGNVTVSGTIRINNNANEIAVTITSFSKINLDSADEAIHFQQLTNNSTAGYYPIRGTTDLPKTRIKVTESTTTTVITYAVNGTGVTADTVALFVDATKLKTKGGTPVLAGDHNLKRGEVTDSLVRYVVATGTTAITYTYAENFAPAYNPIEATFSSTPLRDSSSKLTGTTRIAVMGGNKAKPADTADYESGLATKLNDAVVIQYREPGKREYSEKKVSWTYHDATSTTATDLYAKGSYTADVTFDKIGTEWRIVYTMPEGLPAAPAWYKDAYGHEGVVYKGTRAGAKGTSETVVGPYVLHKTVPTYIVTNGDITTGSDLSASYNPTNFGKDEIRNNQKTYFSVDNSNDNWFVVRTTTNAKLDPNNAKDFIVVDANKKKIAADVEVVKKNYNDSTTGNGDVDYVKITVKDVRYRNSLTGLKVAVGKGTKVVENKLYPSMTTFGLWEDVADDDLSGYSLIMN